MKKVFVGLVVMVALSAMCWAAGEATETKENKAQTLCPILGKAIDKAVSVEVAVDGKTYKIYCCCQDCVAKVQADPKAALDKIIAAGELAEVVEAPLAVPAPPPVPPETAKEAAPATK